MSSYASARVPCVPKAVTRRVVLGALIGAVTVAASEIGGASAKTRNKNKQRKLKRCKQDARRCQKEASAYCAANYPDQVEVCRSDINRCCRFLRKCGYARTNSCGENVIW